MRTSARRMEGLDIARALAVYGMVAVNFKTVMGAGHGGPAWLATAAVFCIAGTLFATLWRRRHDRGPLEILMRRSTTTGR